MELPKGKSELSEIIMSNQEAEQFAGAIWRKPTEEELDELAQFFAEDFLTGEVDILGRELDSIEYLIHLNKEKEDLLQELKGLTTVMDLVKLDIQIFYTYSFNISKGSVSNQLSVGDGLCRVFKKNGVIESLYDYIDL